MAGALRYEEKSVTFPVGKPTKATNVQTLRQLALDAARTHCQRDVAEGWSVVDAVPQVLDVDFDVSLTGKAIGTITAHLRRPIQG